MNTESPFDSFFLAGFECSAHRKSDGLRLDLLEATSHSRLAAEDYALIARLGMRSARDGLRWHLVEKVPGFYDWSNFLPMLRAAEASGVQVIWDLCHFGWPDWVDVWSPSFIEHFANFCHATAQLIASETDRTPIYCPLNEISFCAWAGGEVAHMNPYALGRGAELKRQFVRAASAAIEVIKGVDPRSRFLQAEPLINIVSATSDPEHQHEAETCRLAQYEAYDMVSGRTAPELGGRPEHLDVIGVNYYPHNQWFLQGGMIPLGHHAYRPLSDMLREMHARYGKPILIAETGSEGGARPYWLHYVCGEVREVIAEGVPVVGICLYPVLDYPGWEDGRTCDVGLLSLPEGSVRRVHAALLAELHVQQARFSPPAACYAQGKGSVVRLTGMSRPAGSGNAKDTGGGQKDWGERSTV